MKIKLLHGDCLDRLKELPDNSVDSIVTDPPYELSNDGQASPDRVAFEVMFPNYSHGNTHTFSEDELFLFVKQVFLLSGIDAAPRVLPSVPIGSVAFNEDVMNGQVNIKDESKSSVTVSNSNRPFSNNANFSEGVENVFFKLTDFAEFVKISNEIGTCFYSGGIGIGLRICPSGFPRFVRRSGIVRRVLDDIGISDSALSDFIGTRLTTKNKPVLTFESGGGLSYDCPAVATIVLFTIADLCGSKLVRTSTAASGLPSMFQSINISVIDEITNGAVSFNYVFHNVNIQKKGFMGKAWDGSKIAYNVELWGECLRVLKHGGHLLAFSGTRTYHRMASAIEDAGFEVRDMIEWVYGSGFPKSLAIGKAINKLETSEWSNISKAIDNTNKSSIFALWKNNSNNVKIVETQLQKSQIEIGICMLKSVSAQENATESLQVKNTYVNAIIAELNLCEALLLQPETKELIALQNVEATTKQLQSHAKFAEQLSQSHNHKSLNIFTAECDVKELQSERTPLTIRVEEALMTLRGNKKYSNEEITNVLCVAIQSGLKHTILNQSKTFQNLDTSQQMECVSATNVIITKYIAECLITNTVNIAKQIAVDKLQGNEREVVGEQKLMGTARRMKGGNFNDFGGEDTADVVNLTKGTSPYEGWGTALKPAHEPICMARKPLAEKTVAENCLKWGTGGINIDESRVEANDKAKFPEGVVSDTENNYGNGKGMYDDRPRQADSNTTSRFPANLIHDNSEEVRECFPETKSKGHFPKNVDKSNPALKYGKYNSYEQDEQWLNDSGNASRFFKSIIYQAKASKADRGKGNIHSTVKPTALMQYLITMVTPKGGTVLDPFMGSGTTGVAAVRDGFAFIGIEREADYFEICKRRIEGGEPNEPEAEPEAEPGPLDQPHKQLTLF